MRRVLKRRLGYGTVGELAAWLAVIAAFVGLFLWIATALPQPPVRRHGCTGGCTGTRAAA
jgi:hypothetical protein